MRTLRTIIILSSFSLLLLFEMCREQSNDNVSAPYSLIPDSTHTTIIADTIIYEVIIQNPNPGNEWNNERLQGLNRSALIDSIFEMIYMEKVPAYNHETNEKLTPRQVHKMESDQKFNRDDISMIQFTEVWYLNPGMASMTKKVISMVLGKNFYTTDGELFGYEPVLRVEMGRGKE
jgi:hypothetical protein